MQYNPIQHYFVFQICDCGDPNHEGAIGREGLYKALALTALAQQGKAVNEKLLEGFIGMGSYMSLSF